MIVLKYLSHSFRVITCYYLLLESRGIANIFSPRAKHRLSDVSEVSVEQDLATVVKGDAVSAPVAPPRRRQVASTSAHMSKSLSGIEKHDKPQNHAGTPPVRPKRPSVAPHRVMSARWLRVTWRNAHPPLAWHVREARTCLRQGDDVTWASGGHVGRADVGGQSHVEICDTETATTFENSDETTRAASAQEATSRTADDVASAWNFRFRHSTARDVATCACAGGATSQSHAADAAAHTTLVQRTSQLPQVTQSQSRNVTASSWWRQQQVRTCSVSSFCTRSLNECFLTVNIPHQLVLVQTRATVQYLQLHFVTPLIDAYFKCL